MTSLWVVLPVSLAVVLVNAFFVLSEFASVRARRTRIEQLADGGNLRAARLLPVLTSPARLDRYVATCQLGITASSLALGFYGQNALAPILEAWLGGWLGRASAVAVATVLALVTMTALQILVGELVPKAIAVRHPEQAALWTAAPMRWSERALAPFVWLFNGTANLLLRALRMPAPPAHAHVHSPAEIELLVAESGRAGTLDPVERRMLHNAFDLTQLVARQVMIPRNRLVLAPVDTPVDELLARLATSPFSRLPVYDGSPDNVLGIVHLKDLFRLQVAGGGAVADVVRTVPVVPETMPVGDLWQVLNHRQTYLALVIDEYGGTAGIVTQEDLLEEIIGEVQDEFDAEGEVMEAALGGGSLVRGDVLVEHVNADLGLDLPTDRADTLGGLVVDALGRMAEPGDVVTVAGVRLEVHSVRGRVIERVAVAASASAGHGAEDG